MVPMTRPYQDRRSTRPQCEQLEARTMPSSNPVWVVHGDPTFDNTIVIQHSPQNAHVLQAVVNGEVISEHGTAVLSVLRVYGGAGDDSISVKVADRTSWFIAYLYFRAGNYTL